MPEYTAMIKVNIGIHPNEDAALDWIAENIALGDDYEVNVEVSK